MKSTILASLTLAIFLAIGLSGCGASGKDDAAAITTPRNEVDVLIDDYEKSSNDCLRLFRKHNTGDVSITVLLIVARKTSEQEAAKLGQAAPKMTPSQAQRVAAIAAKTAPCLGP